MYKVNKDLARHKVGEDLANVRSHIRAVNPLHPNISVHILHTVLYTFLEALYVGDYFLDFRELSCFLQGDIVRRN